MTKKILVFILGVAIGYYFGVKVTKSKMEALKPSDFWGHGILSAEEMQRMDNAWEEMQRRLK